MQGKNTSSGHYAADIFNESVDDNNKRPSRFIKLQVCVCVGGGVRVCVCARIHVGVTLKPTLAFHFRPPAHPSSWSGWYPPVVT